MSIAAIVIILLAIVTLCARSRVQWTILLFDNLGSSVAIERWHSSMASRSSVMRAAELETGLKAYGAYRV